VEMLFAVPVDGEPFFETSPERLPSQSFQSFDSNRTPFDIFL